MFFPKWKSQFWFKVYILIENIWLTTCHLMKVGENLQMTAFLVALCTLSVPSMCISSSDESELSWIIFSLARLGSWPFSFSSENYLCRLKNQPNSLILHCKPIPVMKTGVSLFRPCTDPVRDCSVTMVELWWQTSSRIR